MKQITKKLYILTLIICLFVPVFAEQNDFIANEKTVYTKTNISYRLGPGYEYKFAGTIDKDIPLHRLGVTTNDWAKLIYEEETIYIPNRYLTPEKTSTDISTDMSTKNVKNIYIGDSRTVGMCNAVNDTVFSGYDYLDYTDKNGDIWIAHGGIAYNYLVNTAIPTLDKHLDEECNVIIYLGLNDDTPGSKYAQAANSLAEKYPQSHIFYSSINPVNDNGYGAIQYHRSNELLRNKNLDIQNNLVNVQYLDIFSEIEDDYSMWSDGIHYNDTTSMDIYNITNELVKESIITKEDTSVLTYDISEDEVYKIAKLCYREQGSNINGFSAEASLLCNLTDKSKYSNPWSYAVNSGWFGKNVENKIADLKYTPSEEKLQAIRDIVINGNRTLPINVVEHDCLSDIVSVTNNGEKFDKTDRSQYIPNVTTITNRFGATYIFYAFPAEDSDPFGYFKE